jgi:hypothetical protein
MTEISAIWAEFELLRLKDQQSAATIKKKKDMNLVVNIVMAFKSSMETAFQLVRVVGSLKIISMMGQNG